MPRLEPITKHFSLLSAQPLFSGFSSEEISGLLELLQGKLLLFSPEESISTPGERADRPRRIGLLLRGRALHTTHDIWGNRTIIEYTMPGGLLGGVHAFGGEAYHHVHTIAEQECLCLYLFLPETEPEPAAVWARLEWNLLKSLSKKNLRLFRKADILSRRSLREKLLAYLSYEREIHRCDSFRIPLNRQELADYLCADRTSLSTELGKMRRDGLIDFDRSDFYLHLPADDRGGRGGRSSK